MSQLSSTFIEIQNVAKIDNIISSKEAARIHLKKWNFLVI